MITKEQYEKLTEIIKNVSESTEKLDIKYSNLKSFKTTIGQQVETINRNLDKIKDNITENGKYEGPRESILGVNFGLAASYIFSAYNLINDNTNVSAESKKTFIQYARFLSEEFKPLLEIFSENIIVKGYITNLENAVKVPESSAVQDEYEPKADAINAVDDELNEENKKAAKAKNNEAAEEKVEEKHDLFDVDYFHETHLENKILDGGEDVINGRGAFNNDDKNVLSKDGSTEYKALKQTLDKKYNYEDRFKFAWEYLRRKSTEPWHDEGKKRVQSAAKLMADAAIKILNNADSFEDISKDYIDAIRAEACRNGTFRKAMLGSLRNVNLDDDKAKLFAEIKLCDLQCQAIGKDALVTGKMNNDDVTKDGRFKDALKKMDAFAGVVNQVCEIRSKKNYFFTPQVDLMDVMDVDGKNVLEQMNSGKLKPAPKPAAPQKQGLSLQ